MGPPDGFREGRPELPRSPPVKPCVMGLSAPLRFTFAVIGLAASGSAIAQTAECQRYRAELASLGGGRSMAGALHQQRTEIARLSTYYQSIGCERGGFLFFGGAPPAECNAIAQRIHAMQASYGRIATQAEAYGSDARRQQLMAAIRRACDPLREAEERRARKAEDDEGPRRLGGGRLVCVRACDGFFFPLHNLPESGRSDADDMCKALCPGAQAAAYSMPGGADADIKQAVSLQGKRYTKLAAAFKYQKSFDPSCSCRKEGQSWAEALQKAEKIIERGKGDIIVTAKKAEELSRPKLTRKGKTKPAEAQVAGKVLDVETTGSVAPAKAGGNAQGVDAAKAVPASASESDALEGQKVAGDGEDRKSSNGEAKRRIRVIGPTFISFPAQTAE
jgi:Protein of unknown function (DUF2865)